MKSWQTLALCFSILISILASSFYLKYEPKTLLKSNYGPVDLGKVFSEKVAIDVALLGIQKGGGGFEKVVDGASYYEKSEPVNLALVDIVDRWNVLSEDGKKLSYEEVTPINDNQVKIRVRTYISYSSSNFMNMPYIFTIKEETHYLSKNVLLKTGIEKIINQNFEKTKVDVAKNLFITNKNDYGLNSTSVESVDDRVQFFPASTAQ